ncbi:hypothetical protein C367_05072 [Cryptococcus neoformans Ze90-1]|nr:hypothetical protein C367_05072 [Cryptococcus neoformans var. grubii Ze90-1]
MSPPPMTFPTASASAGSHQRHDDDNSSSRWSGENIKASNGYSALFTSGLFHESPSKRSQSQSKLSPATPERRHRRSSIMHTTPSTSSPRIIKSQGLDGGVERALDSVMRSLKIMAMSATPRKVVSPPMNQSRWSAWSSDSEGNKSTSRSDTPALGQQHDGYGYEDGDDGFFKPRKSNDTTRSKNTIRSIKSSKSSKSRKGRKSEETVNRMELDGEDVPAIPAMPIMAVPTTPGKSRRMITGLVKRLGLTPSKNKSSLLPLQLPPDLSSVPRPVPVPVSEDRIIPRKSSLSTLRSALTKKGSSTTLRSVRSIRSTNNASMTLNHFSTDDHPLPLPLPCPHRDLSTRSPRTTPGKGRRTPKSSIGQPKLQPETSPSAFLRDMPRRAPETPKRELFTLDHEGCEDTPELSVGNARIGEGMWFGEENGEDIVMADETMEAMEIFTPPPAAVPATTVRIPESHPFVSSASTPSSQSCLSPEPGSSNAQGSVKSIESFSLPFSPVSLSSRLAGESVSTFTSTTNSRSMLPAGFTGPSPIPVPSALNEIVTPESTAPILTAEAHKVADGKGKNYSVDGYGKNRLLNGPVPSLGSPLTLGHGTGAPRKLRTAKASLSLGTVMRTEMPLSSKDTNALGLPVPPRPSLEGTTGVKSKMSKMSKLSMMSKFSKPPRGGAGPAAQLQMQNQNQNWPPLGKMSLGTVASYYDVHTGTFGPSDGMRLQSILRTRYDGVKGREKKKDNSSPPPFCGGDSHTYIKPISVDQSSTKFEDPIVPSIFNPKHSPSLSLMSGCSLGSSISKGGDSIVTGETGETGATSSTDGVEEWELEKYLNALERQSMDIGRRGGYI